jgi:hypothetical protein
MSAALQIVPAASFWTLPPDQLAAHIAARRAEAPAAVIPFRRPSPSRAVALRRATPALRPAFRGYDDFQPVYTAAREAAIRQHGPQWYLDPAVCLKARLPVAWVHWKGLSRSGNCPRDVNMPVGKFWPGGKLPYGPDYAPITHVAMFADPPPRRPPLLIEGEAFELLPTTDDEFDA